MRKTFTLAACLMSASVVAVPAIAGVIVIGSSPGRACYEAARNGDRSSEALATCDSALAGRAMNHRDQVATYVNRSIVKILRGSYDPAIRDFDQAIALDPHQPESYLNKGSALLRSGAGGGDAIPLFSEALQRKTKRPELAYFGRAIAYEQTGDVKSAYLDYRRAHEADPRWEQPAEELKRFQVKRAGS